MLPEFLSGGGELGQMIRAYDWSATSLGPVETWPQSLRTCIRIMLTSRQPIWIGWGRELIKFYNDPYKAIVGGKHPHALGAPASVVWKDIWRDIEPLLRQVMDKDEGIYVESQLLIMERNGYPEETYYTFSYTPIPGDDGGTAGMICANTDDTDRIISERQLKTLTQLGARLTDAKSNEKVIAKTIATLSENPHDFPFAIFYQLSGDTLQFSHSTDLGHTIRDVPQEINLNADSEVAVLLCQAAQSKKLQVFEGVQAKIGIMPKGAWEIAPDKAIILPIIQQSSKEPYGFLVTGCNPYRLLDEKYRSFFTLITDQVTTSFANVHNLEEERKRVEALAEIDRAKTTFFSNISHEFRTPLTLLLGPVEDALTDPETIPANKARMEVAYRNALRMQKLVNTLLEFSRIEAGRVEGKFTRVDIATFTEDLASVFRSAIEKAGMELQIVKGTTADDVYVDVDMWEKIILNLVSNAFKYSTQGSIRVEITQQDTEVRVTVTDTGIGIPEDQLDKIFNRFHRVENTDGRSQEGTGIGLAMVKELVKLHHGSITVESTLGKGSAFTVAIPIGKNHLPSDKLVHESAQTVNPLHSAAFVLEASKWATQEAANDQNKPGLAVPQPPPPQGFAQEPYAGSEYKSTILLADDNADMRDYVQRLLSDHYIVLTAVNGEEALRKLIEFRPELLISDIMMPKMDGFELLRRIRSYPDIKNTPVIFLSARAGEEAKVEGLDAGADDYLIKPFSARELIVRVANHIQINRVRRQTEHQFYQLFLQTPALINVMKGPEHRFEFFHPKNREILGNKDFTGLAVREALPELAGQGIFEMLDEVYQTGRIVKHNERYLTFVNDKGETVERYLNFIYQPWYDAKGKIQGILNFALDVTESVRSRMQLEISEQRFRNLIMQAPVSIVVLMGRELVVDTVNDNYLELVGRSREGFVGEPLWKSLSEVRNQGFEQLLQGVMDSGVAYTGFEHPLTILRNGKKESIYVNFMYSPLKDIDGATIGIMVVATEVTPQVVARKKIEESEQALNELANAMPQLVWVSASDGEILYFNERLSEFAKAHQLANGHWSWQELIHPDDAEAMRHLWWEAVEHKQTFQFEHRIRMRDGAYRWHLSRGIAQKDPEGTITKWFGTTTDIHMAREQAAVLEEEVRKRTLELRELNVSLQQSNDDLQQFAHVASHDLKEPVRKIKTFTGRIKDEYGTTLPGQGNLFLEKVQNATERMMSMIEGVLTYSKLSATEQQAEMVDLNEICSNVVNDLELIIQQKRATLTWEALPVIQGAAVLIHQLFYNLINNSLKFAKSNEPPVISITCFPEQLENREFARILLTDNGIGFEMENADKIFNPFIRLNSKDEYEGTGLGLALCKKIVERHQGRIAAVPEPKGGATFVIHLPLQQTPDHKRI
jgi:PAS domain S-box-containing protein